MLDIYNITNMIDIKAKTKTPEELAYEKGKADQFKESYNRFCDLYETCVRMKEDLDLLKSMMVVKLK
jgi:hypothetical protein